MKAGAKGFVSKVVSLKCLKQLLGLYFRGKDIFVRKQLQISLLLLSVSM